MKSVPVDLQALLGTAINATLGVLAYVFNWDQELVSLLLALSGAWTAVIAYAIVRPNVTPVEVVDQIALRRGISKFTDQEYKQARAA